MRSPGRDAPAPPRCAAGWPGGVTRPVPRRRPRTPAGGWIAGRDCGSRWVTPAPVSQMRELRAVKESASEQVAGQDPQHLPFGVKPDFILQLCWFRYQGQPESAAASCVTLRELLTLSGPRFSLGGEDLQSPSCSDGWSSGADLGGGAAGTAGTGTVLSVLCSRPHNAAWVRTAVPVFLWGH